MEPAGRGRRVRPAAADRCAAAATAREQVTRPSGPPRTCSAAAVVPPGLVTLARSCAHLGRLPGQPAGAHHGGARQSHRQLLRQFRLHAGRGQRLDQMKDIGRAAAGNSGYGVQQLLVGDPVRTAPTAAISSSATSRWASVVLALAHSTVTPRPTAAGVLGMARTMPSSAPSACSNRAIGAGRDRQDQRVRRRPPGTGLERRRHRLRLHRQHQRARHGRAQQLADRRRRRERHGRDPGPRAGPGVGSTTSTAR